MSEHKYRANFLWPYEENSIEALGYEFANAWTEEYQKQCWNLLMDIIKLKDKQIELLNSELRDIRPKHSK